MSMFTRSLLLSSSSSSFSSPYFLIPRSSLPRCRVEVLMSVNTFFLFFLFAPHRTGREGVSGQKESEERACCHLLFGVCDSFSPRRHMKHMVASVIGIAFPSLPVWRAYAATTRRAQGA